MRRPLALPVALAVLVLLAGCAAPFSPGTTATPPAEPTLVSATSTGGTCVADPAHGWNVSTRTEDGTTVVEIAGNVTVPDANYAVGTPTLSSPENGTYVLDVPSHEVTAKPARNCTAVVRYTAVLQLPATGSGTVTVRHDGETATSFGWGGGSAGAESDDGGSG